MSADPLVIATQRIGARLARQWFERPRAADPLPMSEAVLAAMLTSAASEGASVALRESQAMVSATAETMSVGTNVDPNDTTGLADIVP